MEEDLTAAVEPQPKAAGVALHAADTGRVLFLQRALIDGEPAGGLWELPGGTLDPAPRSRRAVWPALCA